MATKNNVWLWLAIAGVVVFATVNNSNASPSGGTDNSADTPNATEYSNTQFGLTQGQEGFIPYPYADGSRGGVQLYSIGWGHQIQPNEQNLLQYSKSNPMPKSIADQLLMSDMQNIADAINNTGVSFSQGQFDACTDLGMSGVQACYDLINLFQSSGADAVASWLPNAYVTWHPVPGGAGQINQDLVNRRQQELQTWNAGSSLS